MTRSAIRGRLLVLLMQVSASNSIASGMYSSLYSRASDCWSVGQHELPLVVTAKGIESEDHFTLLLEKLALQDGPLAQLAEQLTLNNPPRRINNFRNSLIPQDNSFTSKNIGSLRVACRT